VTDVSKPQSNPVYADPEPPLRLERLLGFQQRLFGDMSGALAGLAAYLGDRLGLFRALAEKGPTTAADLARHGRLCAEMTAEWLRIMTCAGYVEHDPDDDTYLLPAEHAMVLASEGGPMSLAGGVEQVGAFAHQLQALAEAFREGGGLPQSSYPQDLFEGMERLSRTWFENELVGHWIAALPETRETLRRGGAVLDVGCGSGRALIQLAKAFPASRFVGYDSYPGVVERAKRNAEREDVADRIAFEVCDIMKGAPAQFDLVTAFDSLHDLPDPADGLRALGRALKDDGVLLVLELGIGGGLGDESGPMGVIHHATKLFYNLPVALAAFGEARGNTSFPEERMRALSRQAALVFVGAIPVRNPLHKLYVLKKTP
jgi:ubiquinone/menaquinone biosynthesis C-methylase UbiE